ncbi:phosphonate C-P lyase system protein PhnH [Rhizobium sp. YIM 134829]|uniref:phosphonate C-P lyase system protein PhnH n=1 Tax=Rhizobium sp. YIM 134829 TaxID=3390453 RepID=UPI0039780253
MSALFLENGFSEPVPAAQAVFRQIMDAFAQPGRRADLGGFVTPPPGMDEASAALLLALADPDTPVWFEDREVAGACAGWLTFQTGAPLADDPALASFALLSRRSDPAAWLEFPQGDSAYPDRSATLILPVAALEGGATLRLTGPGIESDILIAPLGLPEGFLAARTANRALFPLGLDLVLVAGPQALALPRTTMIEEV